MADTFHGTEITLDTGRAFPYFFRTWDGYSFPDISQGSWAIKLRHGTEITLDTGRRTRALNGYEIGRLLSAHLVLIFGGTDVLGYSVGGLQKNTFSFEGVVLGDLFQGKFIEAGSFHKGTLFGEFSFGKRLVIFNGFEFLTIEGGVQETFPKSWVGFLIPAFDAGDFIYGVKNYPAVEIEGFFYGNHFHTPITFEGIEIGDFFYGWILLPEEYEALYFDTPVMVMVENSVKTSSVLLFKTKVTPSRYFKAIVFIDEDKK